MTASLRTAPVGAEERIGTTFINNGIDRFPPPLED
jgi:hypothetical protein